MKKHLLLVAVLLLLTGCSGKSDTTENITASDIGINKSDAVYLSEITPEMEEFKNVVDELLKENFEDYESYYDTDGALNIDLAFDGIASEIVYAMNNSKQYQEDWNKMVEALVVSNKSMLETAQSFDIEKPVVIINIINDLNRNKIVFSIRNGDILYDVLKDKQ